MAAEHKLPAEYAAELAARRAQSERAEVNAEMQQILAEAEPADDHKVDPADKKTYLKPDTAQMSQLERQEIRALYEEMGVTNAADIRRRVQLGARVVDDPTGRYVALHFVTDKDGNVWGCQPANPSYQLLPEL